VAVAGKIAGKARKRPPTDGPNFLAMSPVATVIRPPRKKRMAYSCHLASFSASGFILMRIVVFQRSPGSSSSPPEKNPPEAHRSDEPDDEEPRRGEFRLGLFAVQENHGAPGVGEERASSGEHRAGFESRVGCAVGFDG
jgi:hypothetical protein